MAILHYNMSGLVHALDENLICGKQIGTYTFEYEDTDYVVAVEALIQTLQLGLNAWKKMELSEAGQ